MWRKFWQTISTLFFCSIFFFLFFLKPAFASDDFADCFCWYYLEGGDPVEDQFCLGGAHSGAAYGCERDCRALEADLLAVLKQYLFTYDETQATEYEEMCYRYPAPESEDAATATTATEASNFIAPELVVQFDPDFEFSPILSENGVLKITYLSDYLQMLYNYLLGTMTVAAIIVVMYHGMNYLLAGSSGRTKNATSGIRKVVWGLAMLFAAVALLKLVNPELTLFRALELQSVDEITLDTFLDGIDKPAGTSPSSSLASMKDPCQTIYQTALSEGTCSMTNNQKFYSPTGGGPNCGNHHWFDGGVNGDWENVQNLDWAAPWGSAIRAPFGGTVTYKKQEDTSNRCGNRINLEGNNARITICHAKDFLNDAGTYVEMRTVTAGETIGHVGGECCSSYTAPSNYTGTTCDVAGTACTDPTKNTSCQCQPPEQSGNTTGGHAHVTWYGEGNFLPCLVDSAP